MHVRHSIPSHSCFMIIQPRRDGYENRCLLANGKSGEVYELEDIETGQVTRAILLDSFCYEIGELPESICYIAYGTSREQVKRALCSRYPQLKNNMATVEVLILQKQ